MHNMSLASLSYLNIGGVAKVVCYPLHVEDLSNILNFCFCFNVPVLVLGNASNTLLSDAGWSGVVISLKHFLTKITVENDSIEILGDIRLEKLLAIASKNNIAGFEFLTAIPGVVMASINGNAGAEKCSISDLLMEYKYMDIQGCSHSVSKKDILCSYRKGPLQTFGIIYSACLKGEMSQKDLIQKSVKEKWEYRRNRQPISERSLGCVFKNATDYCAGQLIEHAGLKKKSVGDVAVSDIHANFFVNNGRGKSIDFLNLIEEVRYCVQNKFGVFLELEIKKVGD